MLVNLSLPGQLRLVKHVAALPAQQLILPLQSNQFHHPQLDHPWSAVTALVVRLREGLIGAVSGNVTANLLD